MLPQRNHDLVHFEKLLSHKAFSLADRIEHVYDLVVIGDLEAAVDAVCAADPRSVADGETVEALDRCLAKLEAAVTRAAASFDAGGTWETDGATSAAMWLMGRCGLAEVTAAAGTEDRRRESDRGGDRAARDPSSG